jgi:hypothetical protein
LSALIRKSNSASTIRLIFANVWVAMQACGLSSTVGTQCTAPAWAYVAVLKPAVFTRLRAAAFDASLLCHTVFSAHSGATSRTFET